MINVRRRNVRHGVLLVELLIVISIGSVLLSTAMVVLGLVMSASKSGQQRLAQTSIFCDLAHQFRKDVRMATSARTIGEPPMKLVLSLPNERQVEYSSVPGALSVTRRNANMVAREQYRLSAGAVAVFQVQSESSETFTGLLLNQPPMEGTSLPPKQTRIQALLAADHRFNRELARSK